MKGSLRALLASCIVAFAAAVLAPVAAHASGTPTLHKSESKAAPADEYFGPLNLSILGIRNVLHDAELRLECDGGDSAQAELSRAKLTEASVRDWEAKYPHDNWLPGTLLALRNLYAKIDTGESRERADNVGSWLMERYPSSAAATYVRSALAQTDRGDEPAVPGDGTAPSI